MFVSPLSVSPPQIIIFVPVQTAAWPWRAVGAPEVVVAAQHPSRADQYDTVIVPAHRGYGLGRALKARMLFELRSAEPRMTEMQTWNAFENEPMLKINAELGFQPDRQWSEYEADIADLIRHFS